MGTTAFNKYPQNCDFDGKTVLNIGCGFAVYPAPNVTNLDAYGDVQVKWDLGNPAPLPFADNTFDFILANHILEHVPNWWHAFEECARVLKVGGRMEVWVPGPGSDSILGFRDHINTINHCSWWGTRNFIANANNAWAAENCKGPASDMLLVSVQPILNRELKWIRYVPKSLNVWVATHLRNVLREMGFLFEKQPPLITTELRNDTVEAII